MLPVTLQAATRPTPIARPEPRARSLHSAGVIEVDLAGTHIRVRGAVDVAALRAVLELFAKR